jgi:hypothetical protein
MTAFDRGKADGVWTQETLDHCGWDTAEDCLKQMEEYYTDEMGSVAEQYQHNPQAAMTYAEFMEGWICAARETLKALSVTDISATER